MAEYVEREAVLALSDDFELTLDDDEIFFEYIPVKGVRELPAADVAKVQHGRWILLNEESALHECSLCGKVNYDNPTNFCPKCGARMDGDESG